MRRSRTMITKGLEETGTAFEAAEPVVAVDLVGRLEGGTYVCSPLLTLHSIPFCNPQPPSRR